MIVKVLEDVVAVDTEPEVTLVLRPSKRGAAIYVVNADGSDLPGQTGYLVSVTTNGKIRRHNTIGKDLGFVTDNSGRVVSET